MFRGRRRDNSVIRLSLLTIAVLCSLSFAAEAKTKKKKTLPRGAPVMWSAPEDISTRDLYLGPGGAAMKPALRRIRFIREEKGGYAKKHHFVVFVCFEVEWHDPQIVPEIYIWSSERLKALIAKENATHLSLEAVALKLDPWVAWKQFLSQPLA